MGVNAIDSDHSKNNKNLLLNYDEIIDEIENTITAKNKINECAKCMKDFLSGLNEIQIKQFQKIEEKAEDYHCFLNKEIFKLLL